MLDTAQTHYVVVNTRTGVVEHLNEDGERVTLDKEVAKARAAYMNALTSLPQNQTFTVGTLSFDPEV